MANINFTSVKDILESECKVTEKPIEIWWEMVCSDNPIRFDFDKTIRSFYAKYLPSIGEIIFNSSCGFACRHCIYSADYKRFNRSLSAKEWEKVIFSIYKDLGINTFIHSGRSLDDIGIEVLRWMRENLTGAKIGLIDNGISSINYLKKLASLELDWIDISLDGTEMDHDTQRNEQGSFNKAAQTATYLIDNNIAPKINILVCLTSLNKGSVIELISLMNEKGFKNFFITPVTTLNGYGPSEELKLKGSDFISFINEMRRSVVDFKDTWIEINMYEVEYFNYIKKHDLKLWNEFRPVENRMEFKASEGDNIFLIEYFPLSLNGLSELIVNCNGDVIYPQVMRKGRIPSSDIIGNLLSENPSEVIKNLRESKYEFFKNAFLNERLLLRSN